MFDKLWKYYCYVHNKADHVPLADYVKTVFKTDMSLIDYIMSLYKPKIYYRPYIQKKTRLTHRP